MLDGSGVMVALVLLVVACGDDPGAPEEGCQTVALPLAGLAGGPVVTDVGLEVQPGAGIVVVASATDPQGTDNLRDVLQTVSVFPDERCAGAPVAVQDDLAEAGVEETFGTVFQQSQSPEIYAAIASASRWPVEVAFQDLDGHVTAGRVMARVIR